jgi:adenylate cyclase
MNQTSVTRRLAAILAADVVGYSRMMGEDEAATLAALRKTWDEIFNPAVAGHRGRIAKMMGDGALVEFSSAVDAVQCAVAIQEAVAERGAAEPKEERAIRFRIGVNLGEIVIEGDDILGDGVNIAARLESEAPQGGVLISDVVQGQVRGKIGQGFSDAGEITLKNIVHPVHVWAWSGDKAHPAVASGSRAPQPPTEKPSIAVLPFAVMSNDPEQEFFADGLV